MLNVNLPSHDDEATVRSSVEVRLEDKAISHSVTFHRNSYSGQSCPELPVEKKFMQAQLRIARCHAAEIFLTPTPV
jgi:hypothetical protein